jgi:hypothetical protein
MLKRVKKGHELLVGLFLVLIVVAVVWRVFSGRSYDSRLGMNLVIVGDSNVALLGVSGSEESLILVELPSNLQINDYSLQSMFELFEIDGEGQEMIKKNLGESLGLWVHQVVKVSDEASVDNLLSRLLSVRGIKGLSWLDRYVLYKDVTTLMSKGIVLETSLPQQATREIEDVDGYRWLKPNEAIFVWSRDLWPKEEVFNLGTKVEVINASSTPGLARVRARQLESVGFRVVKIDSGEIETGNNPCVVEFEGDPERENEVLKQVAGLYLNCKVEVKSRPSDFDGEMRVFFR